MYRLAGACCSVEDSPVPISSPIPTVPTIRRWIFAQFLKNEESAIRTALSNANLPRGARKLVNGGSHGLERFTDAFERREREIPA
jgi:hypothetical protein